jgi:1-acyl-sn-glycerol-3-phosphate acyltransferase
MARRVVHLRPGGGRRDGGDGEQSTLTSANPLADHAGADDADARPALDGRPAAVTGGESEARVQSEARAETAADDAGNGVGDASTDDPTGRRAAKAKVRRRRPRRAARAAREGGDPFSERLRALEREIDEALAGAATFEERGIVNGTRDAVEELLAFYADLARAFRSGGVGEALIRLRMIGTADYVDEFGYDAAFATRVAPLLEFLYARWWRVDLGGAEHVPEAGRVLLVANHSGGFFPYDALMLAHGLHMRRAGGGRDVRPLVEDSAYRFPGLGPLLARVGAVRASAENAARLLAREHAVAVFPEGAKGVGKYYRERYRLQRFARGGFVTLALRTGAPLVPVAIIGAEEIHPVLAKWQWLARLLNVPYFPVTPTFPWLGLLGLVPLPTKWRIVCGAPLDLAAEYGTDAADDDLLVNRLKERVRERIQTMIVDALRARDSVFAG